MKTNFKTISPQTTYEVAAQCMSRNRLSGLFVVDNSKIVGVVSEKEIYGALLQHHLGSSGQSTNGQVVNA